MSAKDDYYQLSSTWNGAQFFQVRLHEVMVSLREAQMRKDYKAYSACLWAFYRELIQNMDDEEQETAFEKIMAAHNTAHKIGASRSDPIKVFVEAEQIMRNVLRDRNLLTTKPEDTRGETGRLS